MTTSPANSTRISKRFAELRKSGELGIVAYITAGDPSATQASGCEDWQGPYFCAVAAAWLSPCFRRNAA